MVVDNYVTRKHSAVRATRPRITLHFTPTSGSSLYLVEIYFSIITRQAICRGSFGSVKDGIVQVVPEHEVVIRQPDTVHCGESDIGQRWALCDGRDLGQGRPRRRVRRTRTGH